MKAIRLLVYSVLKVLSIQPYVFELATSFASEAAITAVNCSNSHPIYYRYLMNHPEVFGGLVEQLKKL